MQSKSDGVGYKEKSQVSPAQAHHFQRKKGSGFYQGSGPQKCLKDTLMLLLMTVFFRTLLFHKCVKFFLNILIFNMLRRRILKTS